MTTERYEEDQGPSELQGKRLLLVEDSEDNQVLICQFLQPTGAHVDLAMDGRAGLEMAVKGAYDAILMDIQMPELDGYEVTRRLRNAGYQGPILAITAHALAEDRQKAFQIGCNDHLTKPLDRERLIESLKRHLGERN